MRFPILGCITGCYGLIISGLIAQTHPDLGDLAQFPIANDVWLASLAGEVTVNPEFPVEIASKGIVDWQVADGTDVSQNQIICLTAAKKLELSARNLELKKNRYANAALDQELANQSQRKTLRDAVKDLEGKLSQMELTPTEKEVLGSKFSQLLATERTDLKQEIARSKSKLESSYFDQALLNERKSLDLDLEKAEHDHQELTKNSQVLAFTSGKLIITGNEVTDPKTPIGKIIKTDEAEVRLEFTETRLRNLPSKQLLLEVAGDNGVLYRAIYARTLEQKSYDRNAEILVFTLEKPTDGLPIPALLKGKRLVRVLRQLDKPGHIVPKDKLIAQFPEEINRNGWAAFITKRWQGVLVSYVGPRDLVIQAANEN
jgi:hypothetical protein